jgi:hypothetical protein
MTKKDILKLTDLYILTVMPTEGPKLELYNVHRIEGSVLPKLVH